MLGGGSNSHSGVVITHGEPVLKHRVCQNVTYNMSLAS